MKKFMMLVLAAALIMPLTGCKEKTAADKAADAVKEAGAAAGDAAEKAADDMNKAAENLAK